MDTPLGVFVLSGWLWRWAGRHFPVSGKNIEILSVQPIWRSGGGSAGGFGKMLICSVHLERIKGIGISETGVNISFYQAFEFMQDEVYTETDRTRAVAELLSWISSQKYEHIILAGDFNTIPVSRTIRKTLSRYQDCLWPGMDYLTGTYNHLPWPLTPRIDYIFHSANLKCTRAIVVKESAGDHYPVRAVLSVRA